MSPPWRIAPESRTRSNQASALSRSDIVFMQEVSTTDFSADHHIRHTSHAPILKHLSHFVFGICVRSEESLPFSQYHYRLDLIMVSIEIGHAVENQSLASYTLFKNRAPLSARQRQQIVKCFWDVPDCEDTIKILTHIFCKNARSLSSF